MKQIQMCASILLSVKWNIGRISKVPFEIRKARSTTHSPWYWFITRSVSRSVLVIYPFNPSHLQSSAIFSSLILSRPLKSPFLRDIVQVQYLAYFLKHAQKSFHSSFEVICCCREKYVHSISYHTLIKVAAQTIIRL